MPTLSVLDQSPIRKGGTAQQAVRESLVLAEAADRLGYQRYWVAEHHNSGGLAGASPEILIAAIAARTERIRVGSGGVMLSHYSSLKVAEVFRMLETLYPGRIDLGIGRAPGSDRRTADALAHGPGALTLEQFPTQLVDLYAFLEGAFPPEHPFHGIRAMPDGGSTPELWMLGSTGAGASYAAELGWAFCFAHFISPDGGENVVRAYRKHFEPSPQFLEPKAAIGISVTCAETREEAERLSWSRWAWRVLANHGAREGILSVEEAQAFPFTEPEREYIEYQKGRSIYGTPAECRDRILALGETYDVDEFVVVTITHDFAARVRSYELLAQAFDLPAAPADSAARTATAV
ncbi:MAG: LLM class flavin-dependent oxidoreductase [Tepidiformaceae bacterium]